MGRLWPLVFTVVFSSVFSFVFCKTNVQTFIVRVQNDLKPPHYPSIKAWYKATLTSLSSTSIAQSQTQDSHVQLLHVYSTVFHGFSARLSPQQAEELTRRPEILAVLPDRLYQFQTTRTPQFMGLRAGTGAPNGILNDSDSGSNVIIGVLDTGIWPERLNFHDQDLGPVPSHWRGKCDGGEKFPKTLCNKKLIGARYFTAGYGAAAKYSAQDDEETEPLINSARDTVGHGTHTASTAAGRHVNNASFFGFAHGVAIGVAPKARIAVYKVCGDKGCAGSDILGGIDSAVKDGVDVISISLGGDPRPYFGDPIAIGSFGATEKGILFSASAGNSGPDSTTVINVAPWITTVGASTIDRKFPAYLVLDDGRVITGSSLYSGRSAAPKHKYVPLVYAGNVSVKHKDGATAPSSHCWPNTLDANKVRGKIVVCDRGEGSRVEKSVVVKKAGGIGVVVANVAGLGEGLLADPYLSPGLAITESARSTVLNYISSSKNPRASLRFSGTTQVGVGPAPMIGSFSSRGPNVISPHVLKPDLVAPGVNILAAWPDGIAPTELSADRRRTAFNIISGTSMSCPHVSGVAALLKGAHPNWSPAMIKSAMMTTAYTHDTYGNVLRDEKDLKSSNAFGMGAGHVDPEKAVDPGLVYDITVDDYLHFLCASGYNSTEIKVITTRQVNCSGTKQPNLWDLNYPAIAVSLGASEPSKSEVVVKRTVTHVCDGASTYTVKITNPKGAIVTVDHAKMVFTQKGQKRTYTVRILAQKVGLPLDGKLSEFGHLTWTDGKHQVTSPIVVSWS
jgi:subtilisin family serine protease